MYQLASSYQRPSVRVRVISFMFFGLCVGGGVLCVVVGFFLHVVLFFFFQIVERKKKCMKDLFRN